MKLLLPTDFSIFADFALETALQIAQREPSEIHLYHSANIPDNWEDLPAATRYKDAANKAIALKVRNQLNKLEKYVQDQGVDCYTHYTGGKFLANIEEIIDEVAFDLIVMGSHGASGKEEWFIGSNTQKVIRKLHQNILVVKNKPQQLNFKEVLFVSGLDKADQDAFQHFLQFLSLFEVEQVHIMSVDTGSFFTQPSILMKEVLKDFAAIAKDYSVKTHFYRDISIDAGVRHFCQDFPIELIGISNHQRHPLKRIFQGSNVEMIANHSELPVLSIDYTIQPPLKDVVNKEVVIEEEMN